MEQVLANRATLTRPLHYLHVRFVEVVGPEGFFRLSFGVKHVRQVETSNRRECIDNDECSGTVLHSKRPRCRARGIDSPHRETLLGLAMKYRTMTPKYYSTRLDRCGDRREGRRKRGADCMASRIPRHEQTRRESQPIQLPKCPTRRHPGQCWLLPCFLATAFASGAPARSRTTLLA